MAEEPDAETTTDQLLWGLRGAVTTICFAVMASASLPRKLDVYHPLWPQVVAFGVLTALLLVEIALLVRRRSWSRWRIPAIVMTLGASVLSTWSLAPEHVLTTADWSYGTTSWVLLVLLSGRRIGLILALIGAHASVTLLRIVVLGPNDAEILIRLLAVSVGTIGFPLAAGVATAVLRDIAAQAHAASRETAEIGIAEELAVQLHESRRERFGEIQDAIEPILCGLADGTLSTDDPGVRRSCEFQASRMRRLFAEADPVADPLVHELRHGVDIAERRGVIVQFDLVGSWPTPPLPVRRALADVSLWLLSKAVSAASVTLLGGDGELTVHVLVDGDAEPDDAPDHLPEVTHRILVEPGTTWMEVQWLTTA